MTTKTAATALSDGARRKLGLTCLFGTFVFLQFTVLGLANHAGEGYLDTGQRELIYYALQVFVILGYLLHALCFRLCAGRARGAAAYGAGSYGALGMFSVCVAAMMITGTDSLGNLVASMAATLCLGGVGGAVHLRMSREAAAGVRVARCMGLGSAAAVVAQYLLQIQWGATPLLPAFMLAAFALLVVVLFRGGSPKAGGRAPAPPKDCGVEAGDHAPVLSKANEVKAAYRVTTPPKRIMVAILVTATFILFACFYNEHIHHLMIQSGYASYTVYSWPRLMLVPGYLIFAVIGDMRNGRYVPLASLCIMLTALLNVVLVGDQGAYWLNMCLFYFSIAAFTSYYLLTFWCLAPGTGNPALWAPFGRMIDSGMVLLAGAANLSALPASSILGMDVVLAALIIALMAFGGDFNFADRPPAPEEPAPSPEESARLLARECNLTDREHEVLKALVLTEETNQQIADELHISRRQLQNHISRIYEKTGATTRAGLVMRLKG